MHACLLSDYWLLDLEWNVHFARHHEGTLQSHGSFVAGPWNHGAAHLPSAWLQERLVSCALPSATPARKAICMTWNQWQPGGWELDVKNYDLSKVSWWVQLRNLKDICCFGPQSALCWVLNDIPLDENTRCFTMFHPQRASPKSLRHWNSMINL